MFFASGCACCLLGGDLARKFFNGRFSAVVGREDICLVRKE